MGGGGSVVVDSLFIDACIDCGGSVFGPCNHLDDEERAGCFTLIVFMCVAYYYRGSSSQCGSLVCTMLLWFS